MSDSPAPSDPPNPEPADAESPQTDAPTPTEPTTLRTLAVVAAVALLLIGITRARLEPPAPVGAEAPPTAFSAARARALLERLLGDERPHPVGSAANRAVRARVEAEVRALGLEPVIQEAAVPSRFFGIVGRVENVLVRLPAQREGPAILIACHYDSVPAGPGAADDGAGVAAALETIRALQAGPPLQRPVIVLIGDGEESGLLGAKAFTRHPWFEEVAAVVNLEARGTTGASAMFETSGDELAPGCPDESQLLAVLAESSGPVLSTSLYTTVYELLPNDTDMSVFTASGRSGLNFAFIEALPRYHTPRDDLAHLDDRSLQHHGEHALSLTRALADGDWDQRAPSGKQVYHDVWGAALVAWPRTWATPLAALTTGLWIVAIGLLVDRKRLTLRQLGWGLLATAVGLVLATLAGPALGWVLRLRGEAPWTGHPLPALTAFRALAVALGALPVVALASRARGWGLWAGYHTWLALLGLAATRLPGLTYLTVELTALAGLLGVAAAARPVDARWTLAAWGLPAAWAVVLWLPLVSGLVTVGLLTDVVAALCAGFLLWPLSPFLALEPSALPTRGPGRHARWALPVGAATVAAVALLAALLLPTHTVDRPRLLNLTFHQDHDAQTARWLVGASSGPVPAALEAALPDLRGVVERPFPWTSGRYDARVAPAEPLALSPPELEIASWEATAGGGRRLRGRLRSPRGARTIRLLLPPEVEVKTLRLDGVDVPANQTWTRDFLGGWAHYAIVGPPPEGVEIELELPIDPVEALLLDMSEGLPPGGAPLLEARPGHTAPRQEGDTTLVTRRLKL